MCDAVEEVELADRGAAEPVDHQRDLVTRLERQVGDDRVEQDVDDLVGRHELRPLAAGLPVDADPDLHLVVTDLEERRPADRRRARAEGDAHRSDVGDDLLADAHQLIELGAVFRRRTDGLDDEEVARHAAAADRPGRVLDRDVVVDEQRPDLHAVGLAQLLGHLPRRAIAGVVVDDVQDALRRVQQLRGLVHELDRRAGEDVTGARAVEHALAHDHRVSRLVARAGALDDRDLVITGHVRPIDEVVLRLVLQHAAARELDAGQHLRHELPRIVDELLHAWASCRSPYLSRHAALMAWRMTPTAVAPASTDVRLRSPVYAARPRMASIPIVPSAAFVATSAASASAATPWSPTPAARLASRLSTAGTSASSRVLSPSDASPRCMIPVIAARRIAITSSAASSVRSPAAAAARRKAVPQIGPLTPPTLPEITKPIFLRTAPMLDRSNVSYSAATTSKPLRSE